MAKIVRNPAPPLLFKVSYLLKKFISKPVNRLFGGDDELFKRLTAKAAAVYGEYGCGNSSLWVYSNTSLEIYSVDTSSRWVDFCTSHMRDPDRKAHIQWIDLGEVGSYGRPLDYSKAEDFASYTDWIWQRDVKPDLVLIDGRFRVCCFLTCLKYGAPGTQILFDDYTDRPQYRSVEKYLAPVEFCGRQALFVIPEQAVWDSSDLEQEITSFRYVMD